MSNKVLCLFVHYFDKASAFEGKSKNQQEEIRAEIVRRALGSLHSIRDMDVVVCGYKNSSLVGVDRDLSVFTSQPQYMMYEALSQLAQFRNEYDYFMVIEDDILVGSDMFNNVYDFDRQFDIDQIMLPNRVEIRDGKVYCIDTRMIPGMTDDTIEFNRRKLAVHNNPHSGLLLVNRDKLDYLADKVDASYRGKFIGGYMASAFAHYHRPFRLYRVADGYDYHTVLHMDPYAVPKQSLAHRTKSFIARGLRPIRHLGRHS
jgi:hypothetical protein